MAMAIRKLIFGLLCLCYSNGFYFPVQDNTLIISKLKSFDNDTDATIRILVPSKDSLFPLEIEVSFAEGDRRYTYIMHKNDFNNNSPPTYIGNPKKMFTLLNPNIDLKAAHYSTLDNSTSATLILNDDVNKENIVTNQDFRIILTSTESDNHITLIPILMKTKSFASPKLIYTIERNKISDIYKFGLDFLNAPNFKYRSKVERQKRAVNGQPVTLYTETLVVADHSILDKQKALLNTNDTILCFQHMKIYYSHIMAAVSLRYENSLANDPDLRIKITIAGFLFQTTQAESNWTNPAVVGNKNTTTNDGRVVVDAALCLSAFSKFMSEMTLPFSYDNAVGLMNKDIFSSSGSSSPSGSSWTPGMCQTDFKYSIIEDNGFSSISHIAHEMGHSFGAYHDGDSIFSTADCAASLNYIMTPSVGVYSSNYENTFLFSSCSIRLFKSTILFNNGTLSTYGNCLLNVPKSQPIETTYFNLSMDGQLWSADFQCKMKYNTSHRWCTWQNISQICQTIYCTVDGASCVFTNGVGAVDGTPCGINKVCQLGQCVSSSVTKTPSLSGNICGPPSPCLNGGKCTVIEYLYICVCPSGYSGVNCEISLNANSTTTATITTFGNGLTTPIIVAIVAPIGLIGYITVNSLILGIFLIKKRLCLQKG